MLARLRGRLFLSYVLLMAVMLIVVGVALFAILNLRNAPPETTYLRLATTALSVDLRQILAEAATAYVESPAAGWERLTSQLDAVATDREVRILIVREVTQDVLYDSAQSFIDRPLNADVENYDIPAAIARGVITRLAAIRAVRGIFSDGGDEWLFVGLQSIRQPTDETANVLLFADPRPRQSLQAALSDFGTELAPLFLQAGGIGLIIAVMLAGWITRSITRPLQTVASAASEVAQGHYDRRVPMAGPEEVKAVADAFNQMSEKIQAEQRSQQDFLANVSHDLKTPLTSIQGFSQAIMDGVGDPIPAARIIHEEAGRLNRMVIELTDLARLQAGRLSMQTTPIDMGDLTAAVGQRLAIMAREKQVALTVNAPSMPVIAGDGDRLVQVVTNLISNAIKYTPSGGKVNVCTQVRNGGVEVVVTDTGLGIAASELPRIFERFYQVDKARGPQRGTGLGLAIVQEIIQAHGGRISVTSPGEGQGSTFTVWLPSPQMSTIMRRR
ncbi:MAG: HAMP domain-containing protein [Chloroflexi bacterium]|uniref:sensor histidine kinase n=1 Tax=Candidatus Flexifilum breve TaxID=3140694 RepID=UPI0031369B06|nr:HAMP domain-containing protein [Chloroflexota bacterium]